jgi:MarR family transcriptional regulator, organic hydroperoxide resistance regulator
MKAAESKYCRCMYFASGALARKVEKLAQASWKDVGLSPSHAYLMMVINDEPGMQPGQAVAQLLLTPSTITRLIEKLETKKLVVRTVTGKLTNIYPTPKGKQLQPQLQKCLVHFYNNYSNILGKDESAKLVLSINKITDKLAV